MTRPGWPARGPELRKVLKRARRALRKLAGKLGHRPKPPTLRVAFATPEEFAGFVSDARAQRKFGAVDVTVSPWFPVRPDWTGRLGPLAEVRSCRTEFDHDGQRARIRVAVGVPTQGFELLRAAYPLFYPVRRTTGWGGRRVAVLADAPADLRWYPGGGLRPLPPRKAPKNRFAEYESYLGASVDRLVRDPAGPPVLVERPSGPAVLIDPKVHRPLERSQPSPTTRSASASLQAGRLVVRSADQVILDRPAESPVTATDLRRLTDVTDINVVGLGAGRLASQRLAELAAYGAVLHDAAAGLELDPTLAGLVQQGFGQVGLLDHMNRSLAQVRAVMRGHARAFTAGQLPSVSVILSCQRASMLDRILEQMAAQDHPNVEIVVGCHGFPAPARDLFSPAVQARLGPILEFEGATIFGDVLAGLSAAASGDFISKVDDDDWYGPSHLSDLYTAWVYSEAQLVGRKLALVHFEATDTLAVRSFFLEGYRWQVAGGAAMIASHDLAAVGGWRSQVRAVDRGLWSRLEDAGALTYSCTGPGYVHARHSEPHTWKVSDRYFLENFTVQTLPGIPPAALGLFEAGA